jgi:hypothetical protein
MENIIKTIIALALICFFVSPACAADPFFDEEFKAYEREYWANHKSCWELDTNIKRNDCKKAYKARMANDPRERGSKAYFEKHYKPLAYDALEEKFLELKVLQKKAPDFAMLSDRPHGVVDSRIIMAELNHINMLQGQREKVLYCEKQKKSIENLNHSMSDLPPVCKQYFAEKRVEEKLNSQGVQ